jgi:hypothetical protein
MCSTAADPRSTVRARRARAFTLAVLPLITCAGCGSDRASLPRAVVSVDGARIAVQDNCHDDPRLEVRETASTVEFEFTVAAANGGDCFSCTTQTLAAPVGDRAVIDAATNEPVPTDGDCFTESE